VSSADFATQQSTPHLKKRLVKGNKKTKTAVKISNVVGELKPDSLRDPYEAQCSPAVREQIVVTGKGRDPARSGAARNKR